MPGNFIFTTPTILCIYSFPLSYFSIPAHSIWGESLMPFHKVAHGCMPVIYVIAPSYYCIFKPFCVCVWNEESLSKRIPLKGSKFLEPWISMILLSFRLHNQDELGLNRIIWISQEHFCFRQQRGCYAFEVWPYLLMKLKACVSTHVGSFRHTNELML